MSEDGYPTRLQQASASLEEPLCKKLQSLGDHLSLKQRLDALKNFR